VDASLDDVIDSEGQYQPDSKDKDKDYPLPLRAYHTISGVWPQSPPKLRLHVYVTFDSIGEYLIRLLVPPQDI
jgi:hypothetical protein